MRIAVINETSAADKNKDILTALEGRGHEIINAGMCCTGAQPELTYIHTGLLAALLLGAGRADLVIGGCGTGQGFLNSAMQYPGVFCGLIENDLDAWIFRQINAGNCLSLALNKGYGWAGDVNLRFIFDRFFSVEAGQGYPAHRRQSQQQSLATLHRVSAATHRPLGEIIESLDDAVLRPVLTYPGVMELLDPETLADAALRVALQRALRAHCASTAPLGTD